MLVRIYTLLVPLAVGQDYYIAVWSINSRLQVCAAVISTTFNSNRDRPSYSVGIGEDCLLILYQISVIM